MKRKPRKRLKCAIDDESERIPAAYGSNYAELVRLKGEWDPENLFSNNYNIPPG